MEPMDQIPYNARVETIRVVEIHIPEVMMPKVVPIGSRGTVGIGRVSERDFLLNQECPVEFDHWIELHLAEVTGIPWDALKIIPNNSSSS